MNQKLVSFRKDNVELREPPSQFSTSSKKSTHAIDFSGSRDSSNKGLTSTETWSGPGIGNRRISSRPPRISFNHSPSTGYVTSGSPSPTSAEKKRRGSGEWFLQALSKALSFKKSNETKELQASFDEETLRSLKSLYTSSSNCVRITDDNPGFNEIRTRDKSSSSDRSKLSIGQASDALDKIFSPCSAKSITFEDNPINKSRRNIKNQLSRVTQSAPTSPAGRPKEGRLSLITRTLVKAATRSKSLKDGSQLDLPKWIQVIEHVTHFSEETTREDLEPRLIVLRDKLRELELMLEEAPTKAEIDGIVDTRRRSNANEVKGVPFGVLRRNSLRKTASLTSECESGNERSFSSPPTPTRGSSPEPMSPTLRALRSGPVFTLLEKGSEKSTRSQRSNKSLTLDSPPFTAQHEMHKQIILRDLGLTLQQVEHNQFTFPPPPPQSSQLSSHSESVGPETPSPTNNTVKHTCDRSILLPPNSPPFNNAAQPSQSKPNKIEIYQRDAKTTMALGKFRNPLDDGCKGHGVSGRSRSPSPSRSRQTSSQVNKSAKSVTFPSPPLHY